MTDGPTPILAPSAEDLALVFDQRYGPSHGWAPAMRRRSGYHNPDEHYEALLLRLVTPTTRWLDVGCGRELFPSNRVLARLLSDRCRLLVGVDPDATLEENPFVHERVRLPMDQFQPAQPFDLITMRMVAEHVTDPERLVRSLSSAVASGGLVVIYTVNRFSPVPLLTSLLPFALHQPIKRVLWGTRKQDTFPTAFRMNTRRRLQQLLAAGGFTEQAFWYLDDLRTLAQFRVGQRLELVLWRMLARLSLRYPENCLLGVYRRA